MRLGIFFSLLLVLGAISFAQEANFSVGPQYLITNGSPLFAQPIATPSLSFETPRAGVLSEVTTADVTFTTPVALQGQADLFPIYYGVPRVSVIEITSVESPRTLPASIVNAGVVESTDADSLRHRGYGVPLAEHASFWKARKGHAPRVYTNADIDR